VLQDGQQSTVARSYLLQLKRTTPEHQPMYQLEILYKKQGDWENTVFLPMPLMTALDVMATHNILWSKEHCYRIREIKD